jgi:hypothetical protein
MNRLRDILAAWVAVSFAAAGLWASPDAGQGGDAADPNSPTACTVVLGERQFTLQFPAAPKRTVVQESEQVTATHDQALYRGVQYNASVYQFKDRNFTSDQARKAFFEEYLAGRAMFASGNKLQKKFRLFCGQLAAVFKHPLDLDGVESLHHGIIFFVGDTFVSLTCVHPADSSPLPSFDKFIESFSVLTP